MIFCPGKVWCDFLSVVASGRMVPCEYSSIVGGFHGELEQIDMEISFSPLLECACSGVPLSNENTPILAVCKVMRFNMFRL